MRCLFFLTVIDCLRLSLEVVTLFNLVVLLKVRLSKGSQILVTKHEIFGFFSARLAVLASLIRNEEDDTQNDPSADKHPFRTSQR